MGKGLSFHPHRQVLAKKRPGNNHRTVVTHCFCQWKESLLPSAPLLPPGIATKTTTPTSKEVMQGCEVGILTYKSQEWWEKGCQLDCISFPGLLGKIGQGFPRWPTVLDVQLCACLKTKNKKKRKKIIILEKQVNVRHWGGKKGSQTAACFKVLAVEHPRKNKLPWGRSLWKKKNKKVKHSVKNHGGRARG